MTAGITDKLRKYKSLFSTTLSTSIGTGTSDTITLASVTGLPTDTAITLTFDRVDSGGVATPTKLERIRGIISGGNFTAYVRGKDGTTEQAHTAGAVIEMIWNADDLNDMVDHGLVGHNQDGTHATALPLTSPVLTTPKVVTSINDANGNEVIKTPATTSAVNEVTITNAATATSPSIAATGGDSNINLLLDGKGTGLVIPRMALSQGQMINGKIVPSVASNNLTVALKGLDGNNPSATNPVYVRIGDTVRSITAALSVTKNAATNWFNSGSSELATKEIDYFVYLGYNATDGVVIGFSRLPSVKRYDGFSATSTNERYCAISTITTAAAGDYYENIGRFAATLSATAAFTWTVPTFTATNLIQTPIYNTRWLTWTPTVVWTGSAAPTTPTTSARYVITNSSMYFYFRQSNSGAGTANTRIQISIPLVAQNIIAGQTNNLFTGSISTATADLAPTTVPTAAYLYDNYAPLMDFGSIAAKSAFISGTYEL